MMSESRERTRNRRASGGISEFVERPGRRESSFQLIDRGGGSWRGGNKLQVCGLTLRSSLGEGKGRGVGGANAKVVADREELPLEKK